MTDLLKNFYFLAAMNTKQALCATSRRV